MMLRDDAMVRWNLAHPEGDALVHEYQSRHKNLGTYYAYLWKSSSERVMSRVLWFLFLVMVVLFISIPMLQGMVRLVMNYEL